MILIDESNDPTETVIYISAVTYNYLRTNNIKGIDVSSLFKKVSGKINREIPFEFFSLYLDFLYLINKISVSEKGDIIVSSKIEHNFRKRWK